jgi:hypothetical protein
MGLCGISLRKFMRHNPVSKSLFPSRISFPILLKIVTPSILKVTEYPSLHNCPTESSELFAMAGKTCATAAAALSSGMSNDVVWVDSIVDPFGNLTRKGVIDYVFLRQGALIKKEWHVQPESTITVSWCCRRGGVWQAWNCLLLHLSAAPTNHSLLAWDPPKLLSLFASRLCPVFGYKQLSLVWFIAILYPWVKQ